MKKHLEKVIFIFAVFYCMNFIVSAQKTNEEDKKTVRKPPVIVIDKQRKPKEENPNDKESDKKPQSFISFILTKVIDDDI